MTSIPKFVPLHEVAEQLEVTVPTIRGWSEKKAFPRCHYYAGRWNVNVEEFFKWLDTCPGDPDQDELRNDFRDMMAAPRRRGKQAGSVKKRRNGGDRYYAP